MVPDTFICLTLRDWYVQAGDTANDPSYRNSFERSAA
jgi:hypothetical protein